MVASEMNRDHCLAFETAPKNCILDSFVDYEGYSVSSKGFLPTVVDISSNNPYFPITESTFLHHLHRTSILVCRKRPPPIPCPGSPPLGPVLPFSPTLTVSCSRALWDPSHQPAHLPVPICETLPLTPHLPPNTTSALLPSQPDLSI